MTDATLRRSAHLLALRAIEYVLPPDGGQINPKLDCDRQIHAMAVRVLDELGESIPLNPRSAALIRRAIEKKGFAK